MKLGRILAGTLAVVTCLFSVPCSQMSDAYSIDFVGITEAADTLVKDSEQTVTLSLSGTYLTPDYDTLIARINAIRKEACENGYINPATNKALTSADYVPITWDSRLEETAMLRSAEALVYMAHVRPNGTKWNTAPCDTTINAENLAWNRSMAASLEAWYSEKDNYVNNGSGTTGHYASLINPQYTSIGLGGFTSKEVTQDSASQIGCYCGLFSKSQADGQHQDSYGAQDVAIEIQSSAISSIEVSCSKCTLSIGATASAKVKANAQYEGVWTTTISSQVASDTTWSSSDETIATVDQDGTITAVAAGSAIITANVTIGDTVVTTDLNIVVTDGSTAVTLGDIDQNGKIEISDAYEVLCYYSQHAAGNNAYTFDTEDAGEKAADVNGDSAININDAFLILSFYSYHAAGTDITWDELI